MRQEILTKILVATSFLLTVADGKKYVHIYNYLDAGDRQLTVQCHSGDGDMESRNIDYSDHYSWSFHTNPAATTLFWCSLTADHGLKSLTYNAYVEGGGGRAVTEWVVRDDGVYYLRRVPSYRERLFRSWKQ
ncbi:hypothetical protein LINGRAHAP2_LOCUS19363 [Linum grandiflorum]